MPPKISKNMNGGGCGCAGAQQGGSMASDAVIDLVPHHAWAAMDEHASNHTDWKAAGGGGVTDVSAAVVQPIVKLLNIPIAGGAPTTVNDLIVANISGPIKRRYTSTVRKYSPKLKGGAPAAASTASPSTTMLNNVDNLASFLSPDFTGLVSKYFMAGGQLTVGGGKAVKDLSVNAVMDQLTLSGATKLGELLNDKSLFKSNKSISSYLQNGAAYASSDKAKELAKTVIGQHGGSAIDVLSTLSAANLDKLSALIGRNGSGSSMVSDLSKAVSNVPKTAPKKKAPRNRTK